MKPLSLSSPHILAMSDYPPPENLSHQDLGPILNKLRLLLDDLPNQLPWKLVNGPDPSHYASLVGFQPDNELMEMTGSRAGALNVHLERMFGYAARSTGDGILPIMERGPGVCAIHDVLKDYCTEFPNGEYPFRVTEIEKIEDPLSWWRDIGRHDGAKVLSVWNIDHNN